MAAPAVVTVPSTGEPTAMSVPATRTVRDVPQLWASVSARCNQVQVSAPVPTEMTMTPSQ